MGEVLYNITFFIHIVILLLIFHQVSGVNLSKKWFIFAPLLLRFLFFIAPVIAYFVTLLFLVLYSLYRNDFHNRMLDIFYGLYPVVVESLFNRILAFFVFPLLGVSMRETASSGYFSLLIELLIFPTYYFLIKSLKIDFKNLQQGFKKQYLNRFLCLINLTMIVYFILLQILLIFEDVINSAIFYRQYLIGIYTILFLIMLIYINTTFKDRLEEEIIYQKNRQLEDLANYNRQIESLYNELRNFRHDYINILSSIKTGIDNRDIDIISGVYNSVLSKTTEQFQNPKYNITNLIKVKNEAVKSILSAKLLEAQSKGINISVEAEKDFSESQMELLDFVTILSILMDNAIEGAQSAQSSEITVALFNSGNTNVLIIENTTDVAKIDTSDIFLCGFSSKGKDRGIGLYNVANILKKYPNVSIITQSKDFHFRQTIEMR